MLRRIFIRLVLPLVWRLSRRRAAESLDEFSATELDSAWQSLQTIGALKDPKSRAEAFEHVREEMRHARLFREASSKVRNGPARVPLGERQALAELSDKDGLMQFFAREYWGEREVNADFAAYLASAPIEEARRVFAAVVADEAGHASFTARAMLRHAPSKGAARRAVRAAAWERLRYSWERFGRFIGEVPAFFIFGAIYLVAALLLSRAARRQLS